MPEALLGGYPKGADFGTRVGFRTQEGREFYRAYWEQAIDVPGSETKQLETLSKQTGASIVIGVIERSGHSLFCSTLFFDPIKGLVDKHRKLVPTASERLIWSLADGSTMPVVDSAVGKISSAICWENYMPLFRSAMYAKGVDVWCASTVDDREIWQSSMRHIAYEGRLFVVSACQYQPSPASLGLSIEGLPNDKPMIRGGSVIISPLGEQLVDPLFDKEGLISAEINTNKITEARYDFDVNGHYSRPDIFTLEVNERHKKNVVINRDHTSATNNTINSIKQ
jgi:nitrilase